MARATRSTAQYEKDKPADAAPFARKTASKKRKRTSITESSDQPAAKQVRADIKEEGSQEPKEHIEPVVAKPTQLPGSGDVPIEASDAEKILDVLEMVDTQGLLDRVFPLPTDSIEQSRTETVGSPSTPTQSYSFRALLKNSSQYPLRVLRSAVQHLFPISSHLRSRPSAPAAEQLRFCNLALSLLDQASFHSCPVPLNVESLIPPHTSPDVSAENEDIKPSQTATATRKRKYALVQHLPNGDWWTSLNSGTATDNKELKDLPTALAELVSILPSASTSTAEPATLGAYAKKVNSAVLPQPPGPRQLSCGRFLDYGPYASFAPSFDQDGTEIGRVALGEAIWYQEQKRRLRVSRKGKQRALPGPELESIGDGDDDVEMLDGGAEARGADAEKQKKAENFDTTALEDLLSPDQVATIKAALGTLELEQAVQELLDRNTRALMRLKELQRRRLEAEGGGLSVVEVGSEEWDVAHGILDSLALLASLRPRSSADDTPPLVPPASVLHKLHRTIPVGTTQGWYGTLPGGRTTALRDDTTIHVRSGAAIPPTPSAPVVPPTPVTAKPAGPYSPYAYPNYPNAAQYRGGYGTYTPSQSSSYYPNYTAPAPAPPQTQAQTGTHYPGQQYNTSQQQYSYSSWYNYHPSAGSAAGSTSGRATPQPAATPTTVATNYASFFAATASQQQQQQPQAQRAVANTVAASKLYQPPAWPQATQGTTPTLPLHLRAVATPSSPSTPRPATPVGAAAGAYAAQAYVANYPPAMPAAR